MDSHTHVRAALSDVAFDVTVCSVEIAGAVHENPLPEGSVTMTRIGKSRVRRIAQRVRRAWGEMDYAQRRLLELQTGVPRLTQRDRSIDHAYRSPRVPHQHA